MDLFVCVAVVSTIAGGMTIPGLVNAVATNARFNAPSGVGVDSVGAIYVSDSGNNLIRKIDILSWFIHLLQFC